MTGPMRVLLASLWGAPLFPVLPARQAISDSLVVSWTRGLSAELEPESGQGCLQDRASGHLMVYLCPLHQDTSPVILRPVHS